MVTVAPDQLEEAVSRHLAHANLPLIAKGCGAACAFLESCGYPGLGLLFEALDTTPPEKRDRELAPDVLGLDLHNVSCVFLAAEVSAMVQTRGRLFLRNVRHGLYLVPFSVWTNVGIGCPIDPSFAMGGERTSNPYQEKLALARQGGLKLPQGQWARVTAS